jgi:hypothetical protein
MDAAQEKQTSIAPRAYQAPDYRMGITGVLMRN